MSDSISLSCANEKGASFSTKFNGTQIGLYGLSKSDGGYARVILTNAKGKVIISSLIDMYSKYPIASLKFLSPVLPKDNYKLTVSVTGERGNWSDKRRSNYGSTGYFISLDKIIINH